MGKTEALVDVARGDRGFTIRCGAVELVVRLHDGQTGASLMRASDGDGEAPLADLAAAVQRLLQELVSYDELISWDDPKRARFHTLMQQGGCRAFRRKLFVKRDLAAELPVRGDFSWRTLAEVGEAEFVALMARAAADDPFPAPDFDPMQEWRDLLEHAGASFDPNRWRVAMVDGEPAGVVLPTPYPEAPTEGTLSYIGILPEFRGRGLGAALHASGLRLLVEAGCTVYLGSTDERNTAMARVFERNGCRVDGVQVFLKLPS